MGTHTTFSLGKCTLDVANQRLRVYEFIGILGLSPLLVSAYHEVASPTLFLPSIALLHTLAQEKHSFAY